MSRQCYRLVRDFGCTYIPHGISYRYVYTLLLFPIFFIEYAPKALYSLRNAIITFGRSIVVMQYGNKRGMKNKTQPLPCYNYTSP